MKSACFIPIKSYSERVPGKNFKLLNEKKLYEYVFEHILQANVFDDIYVDTNSEEVSEYAKGHGIKIIVRDEKLAKNTANGNDLLLHHFQLYPAYDYYFQLFATAPYLQPETIRACVEKLADSQAHDSCFTACEHHGFFWLENNPVNYRPCILPRSQDLKAVVEESTGLYGIAKNALAKYRCRIGANPYIHLINKFEAVDINTEDDFKIAEAIGKIIYGYS